MTWDTDKTKCFCRVASKVIGKLLENVSLLGLNKYCVKALITIFKLKSIPNIL